MWKQKVIFLFLSLIVASHQASTPNDLTYTAAVVEFDPQSPGFNPTDIMKDHARQYIELIETESADFDIIVFPESTLNQPITAVLYPNVTEKPVPCQNDQFDVLLQNISCAAQRSKRYVVINLTTKRNCTEEKTETNDSRPCRKDDWNLYNTNIVFDRSGSVISTYRKFNLFETNVNKTLEPEFSNFTTDFGVTFGLFTCFDILFSAPAFELVRDKGIKNIIYPTMWFSELPFLTAVQTQQGWSQSLNVNFLAAGASSPGVGSTGSGIYSGKLGAVQTFMSFVPYTKLLVGKLPKNPGTIVSTGSTDEIINNMNIIEPTTLDNEVRPLELKQDPTIQKFKLEQLDITNHNQNKTLNLCHNGLCCDFKYRVIPLSHSPPIPNTVKYSYVAGAFNDRRSFDRFADGGIQTCAVFACTDSNDLKTCGTQFPVGSIIQNNVSFTQLEITGSFPADNILKMPNTLAFSMLPMTVYQYVFETSEPKTINNKKSQNVEMRLIDPHRGFYTFGIYGRDFAQDNGSSNAKAAFALVLMISLMTLIKNSLLN